MTYKKIPSQGYEKIPFNTMVALGNFPRYEANTKFGYNPDVGNSQEDVWSQGGLISLLSSAETMNIVSSDAADDGDPEGTGAHNVIIFGLNNDYEDISETVILNGTTPVATQLAYLRVNRMYVLESGSGSTNAGAITATASTTGTVQANIDAGEGQSSKIQFSIPSNKICLINSFAVGVGSGSDALFRLRVKTNGNTFRTIRYIETRRQAAPFPQNNPIILDPRTDVTITAEVASGTPAVSAEIQYWLVDERERAS